MDWSIVGFAAGALTSSSFLPQIIKGVRTRSLADVSPWMLGVMFVGLSLWLAYGVAVGDPVLVVANVVGVTLTGTLLLLWARWGRRPPLA